VASLKADSLITVCDTFLFILIWLKIGTNVAGSVEAIILPAKSATIALVLNEKPITCCIRNADIKTPTVESSNTLIFTFFNTFKLISLPPIYNIKADPNVSIS